MSLTIKCGETYGLIDDDISIRDLVKHISEKCVKPNTEYFQVLHHGVCIAEYKKGVIYERPDITRVHDLHGYHKSPFFVKFSSRYKNEKPENKDTVEENTKICDKEELV